MIKLDELSKKLLLEDSIALICHMRPDGDTLGSCLALYKALESLGKSVDVVCSDPVPEKFFFLDEPRLVKDKLDKNYSALVAVDCADISRLGTFSDAFNAHNNTFNIDHHISNTRYAKNNYVVENSSNSENVFDIINEMNVNIDVQISNLLAMGIMTDTGNFRHKNVTPKTLYTAAILVEKGADLNAIYYNMFSKQSAKRAKLFGLTMSKIRYFEDNRFALATVRLTDLENTGARQDETEGFIDFVMGIDGVEVGACLMETSINKFKVSFRSKGVDVNAVAGTFGGGGHTLASGCQISGEYEEVVDKIRFAVSRELPIL